MRILFLMPGSKGSYPAEAERRRTDLIRSHADADLTIDVAHLPDGAGMSPWGENHDRFDRLVGQFAVANAAAVEVAKRAEADGYDAVCPFGLLDIGAVEARGAGLGIPVVGQTEASLMSCALLGRRFSSCIYMRNEGLEALFEEQVSAFGLRHLYVGAEAIGMPNAEFSSRHDEVRERFADGARAAAERGAELVGMVAMAICPTELSADELASASGMPVVDALAAQVAVARWWHSTGLPPTLLKVPR